MKKKLCQECHTILIGRSDKKFCDTYCKTAFHNKNYRNNHEKIRYINDQLKKNRQILKVLSDAGIAETQRIKLLNAGFQFQYITHQSTASNKFDVRFCYEFGYMETLNGQVIILYDSNPGIDYADKLKLSFN